MAFFTEPARSSDLKDALALLRETGLPLNGVVEAFGHYLVVRDEGKMVGLCGLEVHGPDALLRSVAVHALYRGQGVGAVLVDGAAELGQRLALRALYLLTTGADGYFERQGFSSCPRESAPAGIQESWEFQAGCPKSAAFLVRPLAAAES